MHDIWIWKFDPTVAFDFHGFHYEAQDASGFQTNGEIEWVHHCLAKMFAVLGGTLLTGAHQVFAFLATSRAFIGCYIFDAHIQG